MKKSIFLTALALAVFCGLIRFTSGIEARTASRRAIANLPAQGQTTFSINDVTVTEDTNGTADFTVTLTFSGGFRDFAATVSYATANGTATAPGDYTQSSGTVTFPPGPTPGGSVTMTISIPITDDSVAEPTETFTVTLSNPSAPFPISILRSAGTCTIFDDDVPPTLPALSINDATVSEGNAGTTNATFTVSLSARSTSPVTVGFATLDFTATVADNDYNSASGTLTFPPGVNTPMTISVAVVGDTRVEGNENFSVNLSNPSGASIADGQGIGAILNDDAPPPTLPTLSINDATVLEGNAGTTNATFTVFLSARSTSPVTVGFATADFTATVADNDYNSASGTLTFPPGVNTPMTISVAVIGDTRAESNETFFVNLSNPSGASIARGLGLGTILDDEQQGCVFAVAPTSQIRGSGQEAGIFTVIAPPGCAWEAVTSAGWIFFSSRIGVGQDTVSYGVQANGNPLNSSSNRRSGTITIFPRNNPTIPGAVFTVIQEGVSCQFSVSPLEAVVSDNGGLADISVRAPQGCNWSGQSLSSFITHTPPIVSRFGDGSVPFGVGRNEGSFRAGIVRVAGQDVTIYQNTPACPEEFVCIVLPAVCISPRPNLLGTSRQFRDEVLAKSQRGQRYTRLYYDFSTEIVQQMIFHPSLVLRSLEIKERYLPVIEAMVKGEGATLTEGDLEEIDGFLNSIAARGSRELQETIKGVCADLRDPMVHAEFGVKVIGGTKRELVSVVGGRWPAPGDWWPAPGAKSKSDAPPAPVRTQSASDQAIREREAFGKLPMRFELNQGQTDSRVKFFARGPGYGLFLTPTEAALRLRNGDRGSRIAAADLNLQSSIFNPRSSILGFADEACRRQPGSAHPWA